MSVQMLAAPAALQTKLSAATRRIRLLMALRYGSRGLCATALACLLVVGLSKLRLFETPSPWLLGSAIGVGVLVGLILALVRPLAALDVARLTERRADLKERLSSAVEFQTLRESHADPFYDAQLVDADRHAAGMDLKILFPLHLPKELLIGIAAALGLFLVFYLPTLPAFWPNKMKEEMAEVKKQGIQIEKLAEDKQKSADQQKLDETKKAAAEAQKLGAAMKKGEMNKKQALVAMQKLTRKMEETQKRIAASVPPKTMEQAHDEFKRSMEKMQQEVAAAQKKKAEEAKQGNKATDKNAPKNDPKNDPKNQKPESEAMKQMKKAMEQMQQAMQQQDQQQMQQAMEKMAQQMQSTMSQEERQEMAQMMQQLAQSLQNTDQNEAAQKMQQLAQQMQQNQSNMDPETLKQMAQMMKQIGKQMGQCKGSMQAKMDAKMLQELAQALKDGRLSMCMGNQPGNQPGMGQGGKGAGKGWNGSGDKKDAMKDPGMTKAQLMAMGKGEAKAAKGKAGSAEEFAKYASQQAASSKYLPNGKIAGQRLKNGQELQQNMRGDPGQFKSSSPYYQVYQTERRQAESALNKENIPAAYKKQVRDYFDSIKP